MKIPKIPEKDYTRGWNLIDKLMMLIDKTIGEVSEVTAELKASKKISSEEIIEAATKHLTEENEKLKKRDYPRKAVYKDKKYFCPSCEQELYEIGHFCKNCGQKISNNKK